MRRLRRRTIAVEYVQRAVPRDAPLDDEVPDELGQRLVDQPPARVAGGALPPNATRRTASPRGAAAPSARGRARRTRAERDRRERARRGARRRRRRRLRRGAGDAKARNGSEGRTRRRRLRGARNAPNAPALRVGETAPHSGVDAAFSAVSVLRRRLRGEVDAPRRESKRASRGASRKRETSVRRVRGVRGGGERRESPAASAARRASLARSAAAATSTAARRAAAAAAARARARADAGAHQRARFRRIPERKRSRLARGRARRRLSPPRRSPRAARAPRMRAARAATSHWVAVASAPRSAASRARALLQQGRRERARRGALAGPAAAAAPVVGRIALVVGPARVRVRRVFSMRVDRLRRGSRTREPRPRLRRRRESRDVLVPDDVGSGERVEPPPLGKRDFRFARGARTRRGRPPRAAARARALGGPRAV